MANYYAVDPAYYNTESWPQSQAKDEYAPEQTQWIPNPGIRVNQGFHWADFLLFALLLGSSLGIGIYFAVKGQKTTKEYLMGGRNLKVLPTALSIFMSFISAILVLGNTAEMYNWGTQAFLSIFGDALAYLFVALVFVPLFWPLNLTSSFEYLEVRYRTRAVKITGTILLMLSQILYMGIAMFAPATALEAVTGFPVWASILASGVVATIYTTIGGMKAVIWTDVVQGIVYLAGIIVVLSLGSARVGGMTRVWHIAYDGGRIDFWRPDPNPSGYRLTFWSVIVGRFVGDLNTLGTGQTSVQRYCALPSLSKARLSVLLNIPSIILMYVLTCLLGLTVYSYYADIGCDPLRGGFINNPNQLLPRFVMDVAGYPGIPGIFLAVLFSGALSTLSSSLSALSAVTWKMIETENTNARENLSEKTKAAIAKVLALGFGCLGVGVAFLAQRLGGHVMQASNSFVSGVGGPLLGMYVLGAFFPWANAIGAITGAILGLAFTMWIAIGAYVESPWKTPLNFTTEACYIYNGTEPWTSTTSHMMTGTTEAMQYTTTESSWTNPLTNLYKMSYLWYSSVGMGTTVVVGLILSFATGAMDPKSHAPGLIIPFFDRIFCCFPRAWRKKCWCGVDHDAEVVPLEEDEAMTVEKGGEKLSPIKSNGVNGVKDMKSNGVNGVKDTKSNGVNGLNGSVKNVNYVNGVKSNNSVAPADFDNKAYEPE